MKTKLFLTLFVIVTLQINAQITVNGTGGAIPDDDANGITFTANSSSGVISSMTIDLSINHTWVGDLLLTLTSPQGTSVTIVDRPGVPNSSLGCANDNMAATLFDGATGDLETCPPTNSPFNGDYNPSNPLSAFNGEDASGIWEMFISDNESGDTGTLNTWTLNITTSAPAIVNIPDVIFKAYLVGNAAINTNGDSEIQVTEANAFTGTINIQVLGISDLTGIEAFTSVTFLLASNNNLTNIDISLNTALIFLHLGENNLTSIDLSQNTILEQLFIPNNALTSIDISQNLNLLSLDINNNQIPNLNVTAHTSLETLHFSNNLITSIDLSQNTALTQLSAGYNQIANLDISQNTDLTFLHCNNMLLTSLDLSQHTVLTRLYCRNNNQLTSLNVKNGNNTNFINFEARNNPSLTCVFVDDANYMDTNWSSYIDATSAFVENQVACDALLSIDNFNLSNISIYPNPTKGVLNISLENDFKKATIYNLLGKKVMESTIKTIDVSSLTSAVYFVKVENNNGAVLTKRFIKF